MSAENWKIIVGYSQIFEMFRVYAAVVLQDIGALKTNV